MTTQTLTNIFSALRLFDFILLADEQQPDQFSAQQAGYEISEDDLADGMAALIHGSLIDQPAPQISPDEFEAAYSWFLS